MVGADLPFLLSIGSRRIESLTLPELGRVAKAFGIQREVSPELRQAALSLLSGQDINMAADLIKSPEAVAELVSLLKNGVAGTQRDVPQDNPIIQCRHCRQFFFERQQQ